MNQKLFHFSHGRAMALQIYPSINCELLKYGNSWTPPKFLNQRLCRRGLAICATTHSVDEWDVGSSQHH